MKQPYEITLKDGEMPSITINAPSILARPTAWRTRLTWAWRCLRGQSFELSPLVNITDCRFGDMSSFQGCNIRSSDPNRPAIEITSEQKGAPYLKRVGE